MFCDVTAYGRDATTLSEQKRPSGVFVYDPSITENARGSLPKRRVRVSRTDCPF